MKKITLLVFAAMLTISAMADVKINVTNFPDAKFRSYLFSNSYGKDGVLTDEEIARITTIVVSDMGIQSMKGIEFFPELKILSCNINDLTSLDVSKNMKLIKLFCDRNKLKTLDVSKNTVLEMLECGGNLLTTLDLSKNPRLTYLYCPNNPLTSLDLSKNPKLTYLYCCQSQIKGAAMDRLVGSLPKVSYDGRMFVILHKDEGNVMTTKQVAAAKAKGWKPQYFDGKEWKVYAGSESR